MRSLPDWARAFGQPLFTAQIRSATADFVVEEELSVEFSGDGEHDWLRIEKTGANTQWVAHQLANFAGVPLRDVGYSGLKDRHAVTTQWFSVRREIKKPTNWGTLQLNDVRIIEHAVHNRKLKRGTHRGNAFRIAVRGPEVNAARDALVERMAAISDSGVPNYFGDQRFGRDGANVDLGRAVLDGQRLPRAKRSIGISALRSFEFNEYLDARVRAGTWNRLSEGDVAILDGSNSVFDVDELTPDIEERCAEMDIHPSGLLPGFDAIRVEESRRALRMRIRDTSWHVEGDVLWLQFRLGRGSYATAMLREIVRYGQ